MANLHNLRKEYQHQPVVKTELDPDPIKQFDRWFQEVLVAGTEQANAMVLATVDKNFRPSARVMLLKHYSENGFEFFTNYESRKGHEIKKNPQATVLFWWDSLDRQVRIEGKIEKLNTQDSDYYFTQRVKAANISVCASKQSHILQSRNELLQRYKEIEKKYKDAKNLPRPDYWGGYVLIPDAFEFWCGRENRLHDRFRYLKLNTDEWKIDRLAP